MCRDSTTESRQSFSVRTEKKPLYNNKKNKTMSSTEKITFDQLPQAVTELRQEISGLKNLINALVSKSPAYTADQWMNLKELCEYLPSHPAEQTVYGWTSCHQIPFHKRGKRIMFLKSEIDAWLHDGKRKSQKELAEEAAQFIKSKRNRPF